MKKDIVYVKDLKTFSIHETNLDDVKYLSRLLKSYKHIENILNILLKQEYDKAKAFHHSESVQDSDTSQDNVWTIFNLLKNPVIMKAVLNQNTGGEKTASQIKLVVDYFANNQLFQQLIKACDSDDFNDKNLSMVVRRLNSAWSNFFANAQAFKLNPSLFTGPPSYPKPKKLAKLTEFSLPLEPGKLSINVKNKRKKNKIGLTVGKKQKLFHLGKDNSYIASKAINGVTVCYSHGHIYYDFTYATSILAFTKDEAKQYKKKLKKEQESFNKQAPKKVAGLDIGLYNLLSLYVNDEKTPSLIVSGRELISYNCHFNKRIANIGSDLKNNVAEYKDVETIVTDNNGKVSTKVTKVPKAYNAVGKNLLFRRSQIFERRRLYQEDYLQKVSKKVVQYLLENKVDGLVMSKNLSFAKQEGKIKMDSKTKQKFYQLSFGRLLNLIQMKAQAHKIVVSCIDEAYTSKTSSLSADVNQVKARAKAQGSESLNPTDFSGSRGLKKEGQLNNPLGRGLFKDNVLNKVVNADINAAVNHIKIAYPEISINKDLWKLCNPIRTRTTHQLTQFIKSNNEFNKLQAC